MSWRDRLANGDGFDEAAATGLAQDLLFRRFLCEAALGAWTPWTEDGIPSRLPPSFFEAWETLCARFTWSLEPGGGDVGPEMIGVLAEHSGSRRGLGAYYTPSDVTGYICAGVLVPWLLRDEVLPQVGEIEAALTANRPVERLLLDAISTEREPERLLALDERLSNLRVLDPTCGAGAFLTAALELVVRLRRACGERLARLGGSEEPGLADRAAREALSRGLYGVDLSPAALSTCRMQLLLQALRFRAPDADPAAWTSAAAALGRHLRKGDAVRGAGWKEVPRTSAEGFHWRDQFSQVASAGGFDLVIGNPPYVRAAEPGPEGFRTARCPDRYAWVMERGAQLLAPSGRLGMVVPISSVAGDRYRPLAELLLERDCWISTYSNRPAKLFDGVEQRLAIWLVGPARGPADPPPRVYTTPYQHWREADRPELFTRLRYVAASCWSRTGMPVKSGTPVAERIWTRLAAETETLGGWVQPRGEHAVWLHDGPTYWVRALPFPPDPPGASRGSSHYHRLPVRSEDEALALATVLSSTLFYFFYKLVSNCRDLGRREWSAFPFRRPESGVGELAALGRQLAERLRNTAEECTRRYPSGVVRYREYYPARARESLAAIDAALARHYGLSEDEERFLQGYRGEYRGGDRDG
ncbi:MAG: Eco57I restriction-modification methylase domain-containing protein [Armatimonadota bacterium]